MSQSLITGIVPLVALAVLVVLSVLGVRGRAERPPRFKSTAVWVALFAAVLVFLSAWGFAGLVTDAPAACIASVVALVCGVVVGRRDVLLKRFDDARPRVRVARDLIIIVVASVFCTLALELPWNYALLGATPILIAVEALVVLIAVAGLYFIAHRHGALALLAVAFCIVIGLLQYFVVAFKGTVVLPRDIYAIPTAAAVAGQYTYTLNGASLTGIVCACAAAALLAFAVPSQSAKKTILGSWWADLVKGAVAVAVVAAMLINPTFGALGAKMDYWYAGQYYLKQGFFPTFFVAVQDLKIFTPEGYSDEAAQQVESDLVAAYDDDAASRPQVAAAQKQFGEVKPNVIVVMNESFTDMTVFPEVEQAGYPGPVFYNSADNGAFLRGKLGVSAFGGGTANSEFEFLTGISLASVGGGKYPFQMYQLKKTESVARQFAEMGYETTGMHPNLPTNWNRVKVYPDLGFETSLFIDDFAGDPVYHSGVCDAATYDRCLEIIEKSDTPQFVFDVTMQNHSGYTKDDIPADDKVDVRVPELEDGVNDQLDEYLACINNSDDALDEFVGKIMALDEPTVLVFFGDHHPLFSRDINDTLFAGEEGNGHAQRVQQTVYGVWANYDIVDGGATESVDGQRVDDASANYLAAVAWESIGVPLTDHQKALLATRQDVPAVDLFGYRASDGQWRTSWEESPVHDAYDKFLYLEYYYFGSRIH